MSGGAGAAACRRGWWPAVHSQAHAQSLRRGAVRPMDETRTSNTSMARWCSATRRSSIVSLTRWRQRLGEEHITALLQESLSVAHRPGTIEIKDLERVAVDTTVQEK